MRAADRGDDAGGMIAAESLSKRYDGVPVVDDVTFTCHRGTVTGFLGPNGAGKSTTLRMITGLTRPDHGHATVAGVPFVALPNPSRVVGTLLDASAMHPGRSGRNTLAVAAHMAAVPQHRVDEVLEHRRALSGGRRQAGRHLLARDASTPRHRPDLDRPP